MKMQKIDRTGDPEEIFQRTVFLGGALVGCGQICMCRVGLAMTLTPDQFAKVQALAADVQIGRSPGGVSQIREILGDGLTPLQGEILGQIADTPHDPEYLRTKEGGGIEAAIVSYVQVRLIGEW
jgi:hypothetical protein